jgi:hypothetical protein
MVDAGDLKSLGRKVMQVRVLFRVYGSGPQAAPVVVSGAERSS